MCELRSANFDLIQQRDVIFDGEIAGQIMVIEIPFDWLRDNLGEGPCRIFAAAAREKIGIDRGRGSMPEPVEDLFYMFDHVCKFIDPTFDIDENEGLACGCPMLLVSGETTFGDEG